MFMEDNHLLPQLTAEEIRVLGVLIEKSRTTPDYYPLTLNALVTACNQKSARNPLVEYEQHEVLEAIDKLKKKGLLAHVLGDGRSTKYRHTIAVKYPLDPAEITCLGLLFLRGPLTVGEIKNMSGRMYDFEDLEEVQKVLGVLMQADTPFIAQMERKTGQKEARFYHLFAPFVAFENTGFGGTNIEKLQELEERISGLEEQVAALKKIIDDLMS
jgi:uncharacterized protein YceH (UPF0502 family)